MICPACRKFECAQGCTKCDACIDTENRLWQEVLATRRDRIAVANQLRAAEVRERDALEAYRIVQRTEPNPFSFTPLRRQAS
jgi:hypothetical protein